MGKFKFRYGRCVARDKYARARRGEIYATVCTTVVPYKHFEFISHRSEIDRTMKDRRWADATTYSEHLWTDFGLTLDYLWTK